MATMTRKCIICRSEVKIELTNEQHDRIKHGESIQYVAPHLTVDEREIMISGICGPCFDKTLPDPDEEELELPDIAVTIGEGEDEQVFHILPHPFGETDGIIKVLPQGVTGIYHTFGDDETDDQHIVAHIDGTTYIAIYDLDKLQWKVSKSGIKTFADTWSQALAHGYYNHLEMRKEEPK